MVTQTTLSVDDAAEITAAVKARFPAIRSPKMQDICYATQNRQDAVKLMSAQVDVVVVVGSPTSSNSNRLRALGAVAVRKMDGIEETVRFPLPKGLRADGPTDGQAEA